MGRTWSSAILVVLLLGLSSAPMIENHFDELDHVSFSSSNLVLTFTNGPTANQDITGLHSLTFGMSGDANISSLLIEISADGTTWTSVNNITSAPWAAYFDSTAYTNDSYTLRATAWDDDVNEAVVASSGTFNVVNQVPVITIFTVLNAAIGTGDSASDRAWFGIDTDGTLAYRWGASDDDISHASISVVPGPGAPPNDGPNSLSYGWDWSSGAMSEGTWNSRITVYDGSSLSASKTHFIGIDRTGPTLSSVTVGDGNTWQKSTQVTFSGLMNNADDGQGSGVSLAEYSLDGTTWNSTSSDSLTLNLAEGTHTVSVRSIDRVGNTGATIQVTVQIDETLPNAAGWTVDELTTSRVGPANVSFSAIDDGSGIDLTNSYIQFGFDSNGVGQTPDLSSNWMQLGTSGLTGTIGLASWATKSRQYLMFQAVVVDNAGNQYTSSPSSFQILPGLDLYWNATQTNLDRLIVRPGETDGNITITSMLESNQNYGGSVVVRLESAPADRTSTVSWTIMESRTLDSGSLGDGQEELIWNYTVPKTGQFDLRLVIDYVNVIDEYDEGNNYNHMVVTGAAIGSPGLVPSFAPSIVLLILTGFAITILQRRTRD
ncbi:MAG: hypothetical protein OSA21_03140 [Candidatus Poseidoniaceae archaeon]|nr:hypothetical protein [Candidatus Poseidoniaceae archaeon]